MQAASIRRPAARGAPRQSYGALTPKQIRYLKGSRRLARFMDTQWEIGPFRFGAEAVIGLIPGVGDAVSATASLYELWVAKELKVPRAGQVRMLRNVAIDLGIGLVPFLGDAADVVFKSHARNQQIIEEHVRRLESGGTQATGQRT